MTRLRNRTGAVMIMAAFIIVVLVTIMAFVIDLSQMYVQVNQLQTGADAAAHAGAIQQFQGDSTNVATTATSFGRLNSVLGRAATFDVADVTCGVWNPTAAGGLGAFSTPAGAASCGKVANAVRVTGRDVAQNFFQGIWGATVGQPARTAIAWVAPNVTSGDCVKPWSVPYTLLTKALDPANPDLERNLTATDQANLQTFTAAQLSFQMKTDGSSNGNFNAVVVDPSKNYQQSITGCSGNIAAGDTLYTNPGNFGSTTATASSKLCPQSVKGTLALTCEDANGSIGYPVKIPLWSLVSNFNGKSAVIVRMVASFALDSVGTNTSAPKGTVNQGIVYGHFLRVTSSGAVGTTPGTLVRIILVQ